MEEHVRKGYSKYTSERKKALCLVPLWIIFVVAAYGLHEVCKRNARDEDGVLTTNVLTLAHLHVNDLFFKVCERISTTILVVYFMKSLKMPTTQPLQKIIIFTFICIRISITIWAFFILGELFELVDISIKSIFKNIDSTE